MIKIIALLKQVPDIKQVKFDQERGVIDRKSAPNEINPFDLNALEAAVQIKEELKDVEVIALLMGPKMAEKSAREAMARGADQAILLTDKNFAGSDTWATSLILSSAIKEIGDYDLIIAGEKTVDGDTGQVGAQIAEFLKIHHASYVNEIKSFSKEKIKVLSEIWNGNYIKEIKLPCLLTVTKNLNSPRLPSIRDKMASRKAEICFWNFDKLNSYFEEDEVGINGSPTRIKNIEIAPPIKRSGSIWREDYEEALDEIIDVLINKRIIGGEISG